MNKTVLSIVIVMVVAIALGTTSFVNAQSSTPQAPVSGTGYGNGMGSRGVRGGMMHSAAGTQDGLLHDEMIAVYAEKLGVSVDDLNARLANGETLAQIASSKGLTIDQFRALMTDARSQAVDQAVKNGTLSQEQADWMKQRGAGAGMGNGGRGMRGNGQGQFTNPNCPYTHTTP